MAHELEKYYVGDVQWGKFVNVFIKQWEDCSVKNEILSELDNNFDIAVVVYGIHGKYAMKWIRAQIPYLDYLTPIECTKNDRLIKRLKAMLMRI